MIISRSQKTCPEIQLSELPSGPEMKRLSRVLGHSFLFWSASVLCTEKLEMFFFNFEKRILGVRAYSGLRYYLNSFLRQRGKQKERDRERERERREREREKRERERERERREREREGERGRGETEKACAHAGPTF